MTGTKRKAIHLQDEQLDRPTLIKRRTFTYGVLPAVGNERSPQSDRMHDSFSTSPIHTSRLLEVGSFQNKLTSFCERHGSSFGAAYVAELQHSHCEVYVNLHILFDLIPS